MGLITVVIQMSYGNNRRLQKSRQLEKIASVLELKMEELEERYKGKELSSLPEEQDESEVEGEPGYFWSYKTKPIEFPSTPILLKISGMERNEINEKVTNTLVEVFSKAAVELRLFVAFKNDKGKEIFKYSLSTYFIAYEKAPDFIFSALQESFPGVN